METATEITSRPTPETWHERNHFRGYRVPSSACWYCQRNLAVCKSKRSYDGPRAAHEAALDFAERLGWTEMIAPYWCPYCDGWHLTSKPTRRREERFEKARRKAMRP